MENQPIRPSGQQTNRDVPGMEVPVGSTPVVDGVPLENKPPKGKTTLIALVAAILGIGVIAGGTVLVLKAVSNQTDSTSTSGGSENNSSNSSSGSASDNSNSDNSNASSNSNVSSDGIGASTTKSDSTVTVSDGSELASKSVTTSIGGKSLTFNGAYVVDGVEVTIDGGEFASTTDDQNTFLVINGGKLTVKNATISKSGSANFSGRGDNYSFYGLNSAVVVVGSGSEVNLENVVISTTVSGANAVVATNSGSATVTNTTIATTKDNSRGLHATYEGVITASNTDISTLGGSCASLATDRGAGTVTASNMKLSTAGAGSPLIYSTGTITVDNATGTATGAQIAVVEGKNSITVKNSTLSANGVGNRNNVDNAGVMIYQSMSGDASVGTGNFTAENSTLTVLESSSVYSTTPFFFVTNTSAVITLKNVAANFSSSEYFISAKGTSEWGKSGSNGGTVTYTGTSVTSTNTTVEKDDISSVSGL